MTEEFERDEYVIGVPEYEVLEVSPEERRRKERKRRRNARLKQLRKKKTMNIELTKTSEGVYVSDKMVDTIVVDGIFAEGAQDTKIEQVFICQEPGVPLMMITPPFRLPPGDTIRVEVSGPVPEAVVVSARFAEQQAPQESSPQDAPSPSDPFGNFLPEFLCSLLPLFHEAMLIKSQREAEARYRRLVEESKKMYISRTYPEGSAISSPEDELGNVYVMHDYALKDDGAVVVMWEATPKMESDPMEEPGTTIARDVERAIATQDIIRVVAVTSSGESVLLWDPDTSDPA